MNENKVKVFVGLCYYPAGGYLDFKTYLGDLKSAMEYVENNYNDNDFWAHMVINDEIVLEGYLMPQWGKEKMIWKWEKKENI